MRAPIFQVDAFTADAFRGNPAGVCLPAAETSDSWLQGIAAEMNVSETAFLWRRGDHYDIRYFTPEIEVDLCGHATLSSAHILWEEEIVPAEETIHFAAKGGVLAAAREEEWIRLDFPALPASESLIPEGLAAALGAPPRWVGRVAAGVADGGLLVELDSEATVRTLAPDYARLRAGGFGPIIVTSQSTQGRCDFVSRFFAPGIGIDEDPVTGVAHCTLCPFWVERLGRDELVGHQVSKRGGVIRVRHRGERVDILGQAITVMKGAVLI